MSTQAQASGEPRETRRRTGNRRKMPAEKRESGSGSERLSLIGVKVNWALRVEIDEYAKAHGITRSRATGQFLEIAREALRAREGVPAGKAEEILEALEGVRTVVELVGPPTFGLLRLLSHWATQTGGLNVSEDELLAELRTVDRTAERFARLDGVATERAIRDAIQKAFRGAAREVQGAFAIHKHGGHDRPSHPHVQALLSPRL